jgi:hypothetical protein
VAKKSTKQNLLTKKKKTSIGEGKFSKTGNKGGGVNGSTPSKAWRRKKPSRGQGS